jgi:hypothetical protein
MGGYDRRDWLKKQNLEGQIPGINRLAGAGDRGQGKFLS